MMPGEMTPRWQINLGSRIAAQDSNDGAGRQVPNPPM